MIEKERYEEEEDKATLGSQPPSSYVNLAIADDDSMR